MTSDYLTAKEAATYTKLSESYLAKLRMGTSATIGPRYMRIGSRMVRYRRQDLDTWLESRAFQGGRS